MTTARDTRYTLLLLEPLRVCATYTPKMGQGGEGVSLADFGALYGADAFYRWIGFDDPLLYAAHKAAGGMTSVYRQLGIGVEHLFRAILQDEFGLDNAQATWNYTVPKGTGTRTLSLDGRIELAHVRDAARRRVVQDWIDRSAIQLGVDPGIRRSLRGVVFEVRQGYKSKDSKRQNADIANAGTAYASAFLPCAVLMSNQIDTDLVERYRREKWCILTGTIQPAPDVAADPSAARSDFDMRDLFSTYSFFESVVGFDLAAFFERNSPQIREEVHSILHSLLSPR